MINESSYPILVVECSENYGTIFRGKFPNERLKIRKENIFPTFHIRGIYVKECVREKMYKTFIDMKQREMMTIFVNKHRNNKYDQMKENRIIASRNVPTNVSNTTCTSLLL